MIYEEWQDFVIYPTNPEKVESRQDRLNTAQAQKPNEDGDYPEDYSPSSEKGAIFSKSIITSDNDTFEAMDIDDSGHVTIWTKNRVWFLFKNSNSIEQMKFVYRNPSPK